MIATWSRGVPDAYMDEAILLDLAGITERHPWWRARASLTIGLLHRFGVKPPASVIDAGCGWGVTLRRLEREGYRATGLDISRKALELLDGPSRDLIEADLAARDFPFPEVRYDAVLALDVIEHLDDDRAAVANLAKMVAPGGIVIVSVPAIPDLFSEFDSIQGHRRRYEPDLLRSAFADSGLVVERISFWGNWLVGPARRSRAGSRARPGDTPSRTYRRYLALPPWPASLAIRALFAIEHPRALRGRVRSGTSLFAVARKPTLRGPARSA